VRAWTWWWPSQQVDEALTGVLGIERAEDGKDTLSSGIVCEEQRQVERRWPLSRRDTM
jgi:hypothetical protein